MKTNKPPAQKPEPERVVDVQTSGKICLCGLFTSQLEGTRKIEAALFLAVEQINAAIRKSGLEDARVVMRSDREYAEFEFQHQCWR